MTIYVALLRGINVGGKSKVPMARLKELFEELGHTDVRTYIQSGNVIFRAASGSAADIARAVERRVDADMGVTTTVILRTKKQMEAVEGSNPFLPRVDDLAKLHVAFLDERPAAAKADALVVPQGEPEELEVRGTEVFLHYRNGYGRTKVDNLFIEKQLGVRSTTRGWKTIVKLCDLMRE